MLLEAEAININSMPLIPINRPLMTNSMSGSLVTNGFYHAGGADGLPVQAATAVPSHLKCAAMDGETSLRSMTKNVLTMSREKSG